MTNQSILKECYERLYQLPFPLGSDHELINDWIFELADLDEFYTSMAQIIMKGETADLHDLPLLAPLFEQLDMLKEANLVDSAQYRVYQHYLRALDHLAKEIGKSQNP